MIYTYLLFPSTFCNFFYLISFFLNLFIERSLLVLLPTVDIEYIILVSVNTILVLVAPVRFKNVKPHIKKDITITRANRI